MPNRRQFLESIPIVAVVDAVTPMSDLALATSTVAEADPQAKALGYAADTIKTNKAKFPKRTPDQHYDNYALYQGGTAVQGGCPLLTNKDTANKGWCSAWAKGA